MHGFTQNGKHSAEMRIHYIPDAQSRGDFYAGYDVISSERSWFAGGEYYKSRVKTRVFTLDCYYEQITIQQRENILRWLDRRTSGTLVFDDRPYVVYKVRPSKKIDFKDYLQNEFGEELYSGTFSIQFSAYDPFGELKYTTLNEIDTMRFEAETGAIYSNQMPDAVSTEDSDFLIYNPGTEIGHSTIRFAGTTGSGDFSIYNSTTGDRFTLKKGLIAEDGDYYEIDSKTGRVEKITALDRKLDFAFHDHGYITFKPFDPIYRDVRIQTIAGQKKITSVDGIFTDDMVGKYVYIDNEWRYIGNIISDTEAEVNTVIDTDELIDTEIVVMNYLTITKADDANITRLEVICRPEVR